MLALAGGVAAGSAGPHKRADRGGFVIGGHVVGLYPGAQKRLVLLIRNRLRRPLRIRSITGRVRDASRRCPGSYLRVGRFRGSLRLAPRETREAVVAVRMARTAPPACQGAVFRLVFTGRGTAP